MKTSKLLIYTIIILAVISFLICSLPSASATTDTIGGTSYGFTGTTSRLYVFSITASASGNLASIGIQMNSGLYGNGRIAMAIYSTCSLGGLSGILGQTSAVTSVSGWNDLAISGVTINSGTTYYIAYMQEAGDGFNALSGNGGGTNFYYQPVSFGSFPTSESSMNSLTLYTAYMRIIYAPSTVNSTFTSSPSGTGYISVNNVAKTSPYVDNGLTIGTTLNLSANSPVSGGTGIQWIFKNWTSTSIGTITTQNFTYTVPATGETVTANYYEQFYLNVTSTYGVPSGSGWYNASTTATASVSPSTVPGITGTQYIFNNWSYNSGTNNASNTVTMSTPINDSASWTTQYYVNVTSAYGSPSQDSQWVNSGSSFITSVSSPTAGGAGIQYITAPTTLSIGSVTSPQTLMFNWTIQYYITVVSAHGDPTQASQWVNSSLGFSTSVISIISGSSGVQYITAPTTQTISSVLSPQTFTFSWTTQYYLNVSGVYGSHFGFGWYNASSNANFGSDSISGIDQGKIQYSFNSWVGTGTGSYSGTIVNNTVTMNNPINETSTWILAYSITAANDAGSTIDFNGLNWVYSGSNVSFSFSANPNYYISSVLVDGYYVSPNSPYTFTNVSASHTIIVYSTLIGSSPKSNSTVSPIGITELIIIAFFAFFTLLAFITKEPFLFGIAAFLSIVTGIDLVTTDASNWTFSIIGLALILFGIFLIVLTLDTSNKKNGGKK